MRSIVGKRAHHAPVAPGDQHAVYLDEFGDGATCRGEDLLPGFSVVSGFINPLVAANEQRPALGFRDRMNHLTVQPLAQRHPKARGRLAVNQPIPAVEDEEPGFPE
ncbi:MAG: hypothetical protein IPK21_21585 [Haliscomenobacter sp.]|nr:hypothetical protein [Haliscomenobacter sp.]